MAKNTQAAEAAQDTVKVKKPKKDKGEKSTAPTSGGDDYGLEAPGSGAGGDRFTPAEHIGDLLLVTPLEFIGGMTTSASKDPKDVMRANVVVLNTSKPTKSVEFADALIFPTVVVNQLKQALENKKRVVGTFISDTASQKAGQSAPYRLTAPSDADIQVARSYLDSLNPLR